MAEFLLIVTGITEIISECQMLGKNLSLVLIMADVNWKASIHVLSFMHTLVSLSFNKPVSISPYPELS